MVDKISLKSIETYKMTLIRANIHKGRSERVGALKIIRSLPNSKFQALGSVVFIDHLVKQLQPAKTPKMPDGGFAHPHRGIATFTYILEGGVHHLDSNGGEGKVYDGGLQWMKAGNGIVHDEFQPYDLQKKVSVIHGFQFWLNLPSHEKRENPDYMAIQGEDVPEVVLDNDAGKLRLLLGTYEGKKSIIPSHLKQFMGHVSLKKGKSFNLSVDTALEYGLYLVNGSLTIDDHLEVGVTEIAELQDFGEHIKLTNTGDETIDLIVFGGETYNETRVSYGPFVMNSEEEIKLAYSDFRAGKYGKIDYSKVKI